MFAFGMCAFNACVIQWHYHDWQGHWQDHKARPFLYTCSWLRCHGCQRKL